MAKVVLPPTLLGRIDGSPPLAVDGATVGEVLDGLQRRYPGLRGWILDEQGRVREHVNLFVNSVRAPLEEPVGADDELFVIQAISGGTGDAELLVGTRKGLFVLRGARGRPLEVAARAFTGQTVDYACHDPRSGRYLAAVTHGQFGPHLYYADDPTGEWTEADGPAFPADTEAAVKSIWVVEPGEGDGVLWAGVAPAAEMPIASRLGSPGQGQIECRQRPPMPPSHRARVGWSQSARLSSQLAPPSALWNRAAGATPAHSSPSAAPGSITQMRDTEASEPSGKASPSASVHSPAGSSAE